MLTLPLICCKIFNALILTHGVISEPFIYQVLQGLAQLGEEGASLFPPAVYNQLNYKILCERQIGRDDYS